MSEALPPPSDAIPQAMHFRRFRNGDLDGVIGLHRENLRENLTDTQRRDGFLSVDLSGDQFLDMDREIPMVVADAAGAIRGYLCGSAVRSSIRAPLLDHMAGLLPETRFRGRALDPERTFFYGPVCVAREDRGRGVLAGMLREQMRLLAGRFDTGVLFISRSNLRSYHAHVRKIGMEKLRDFQFDHKGFWLVGFSVSATTAEALRTRRADAFSRPRHDRPV